MKPKFSISLENALNEVISHGEDESEEKLTSL